MLPIYPDYDPYLVPRNPPSPDFAFTPISHQLVYPTRSTDQVLDYYPATSQPLFPTPSELLSNISHTRHDVVDSTPYMPSPPPPHTSNQQAPEDACTSANSLNKTESQRKARQRAIAEEIGFTPTDPYVLPPRPSWAPLTSCSDTISSHEKKRHYLECLEQYVLYLHEQLQLVQTAPLTLERVSTYRGLSSRSIRTLLVHMQNTNKTLHDGTLVEEQVVGQQFPTVHRSF